MKYFITSVRAKHQNLELPPDIDPKDPSLKSKWKSKRPLKPVTVQDLFIHQNADEFFDYVEKRALGKIKKDIKYILDRGWADKIALDDFCSGLICGKSKVPIFDMDKLFSKENIAFLYYTHCPQPGSFIEPLLKPEYINRNITSTLTSKPVVVHPKYKLFEWPFYKVFPSDLGLMGYADINFVEKPNGGYELENGTKLDMYGSLFKDFYWFFRK